MSDVTTSRLQVERVESELEQRVLVGGEQSGGIVLPGTPRGVQLPDQVVHRVLKTPRSRQFPINANIRER